MAKSTYRIPASLDRSFLDHEINLSGGGWSAPPLPIKVILFWLASILVIFWAVSNTFIKSANPVLIVMFVIWWLIMTAYMGKYTKTKTMKFQQLPALFSWLPKSSRRVMTRSTSNPRDFYPIVGVRDIDENGLIEFTDNTYGQMVLVVGSASVLLFDEDRDAILNRVDAFYKKIDVNCEWITITTKESQRVYRQVANLKRRHDALEVDDPELKDLMDEQFEILSGFVGKQFKSIHQYKLVKGDNIEALRSAVALLQAEVADSSLMIKSCTGLGRSDALEVLSVFYQGRSWGQSPAGSPAARTVPATKVAERPIIANQNTQALIPA